MNKARYKIMNYNYVPLRKPLKPFRHPMHQKRIELYCGAQIEHPLEFQLMESDKNNLFV